MLCKIVPERDSETILSTSVLWKESVFHLPDLYGAFILCRFLDEQEVKAATWTESFKLWALILSKSIFPLTADCNEQGTFSPLLLFH